MKTKKFLATLSIGLMLLTSCSNLKPGSFTFHYSQAKEKDYQGQCFYTDDYFISDSTIYNSSLATTGLCLAMASFGSNKNNESYTYRYCNVKEFFNTNGFTDIDVNSYYKVKPSSDSLGVCIAHKTIDGATLVAVGVRGGNYEMEWASNVTLGDGKTLKQHQGFYEASTIYLTSLEDYLVKYNISGNIKLWSVGYSRGGATNNLACGRLDQKISSNQSLFDKVNVSLKKEDLYCYCYEPPQGASYEETISPRDNIYSNIHNIVNSNDPVPKVAMSKLRYTRYGVDYYLPDTLRNSDYSDFYNRMLNFYNNIDNRSALGTYVISDFDMRRNKEVVTDITDRSTVRINWTSGLFLQEFIDALTTLGVQSIDNYYNTIQSGLRYIFELVYKNGAPKFSFLTLGTAIVKTLLAYSNLDVVINNLLKDQSAFVNDLLHLLKQSFENVGFNIDAKELLSNLTELVKAFAITIYNHIDYFFAFLSTDNIKALAQGHYPEVCLSNLMALDINYNDSVTEYHNDGSYYYLQVPSITKDTTIIVKDDSGKVVAGLENGNLLTKTSLSYEAVNQEFICYIPVDSCYHITINNAGSYDLSYFDQRYENLISYKSENISSGETKQIDTDQYPEKQK